MYIYIYIHIYLYISIPTYLPASLPIYLSDIYIYIYDEGLRPKLAPSEGGSRGNIES